MQITRRTFTAAGASYLLTLPFNTSAQAQVKDDRPPTIDTSAAREIASGVWHIPDRRIWLVPNICVVAGNDSVLVFDTGLGPTNGEKLLDFVRQVAGKRKIFLTLSHFHPEHGYGAQVFQNEATIIYNTSQRQELAEKGATYLRLFRQTQSKAAVDALEGTKIVMPHFVYDSEKAEIDLGGRTVELHNFGTAHTRGDQIAVLARERIVLAGDLIEEKMFPIFPWFPPSDTDVDSTNWVTTLNRLQNFNPSIIVPGHGQLGSIDIALNLASHIESVGRDIRALRENGKSADDILRDYKPEIVRNYPGWDHPGLLDWEIAYFSSLAT